MTSLISQNVWLALVVTLLILPLATAAKCPSKYGYMCMAGNSGKRSEQGLVLPNTREQVGYEMLSDIGMGEFLKKPSQESPFRRLLENLQKYVIKQQEARESGPRLNHFSTEGNSDNGILQRLMEARMAYQPVIDLQDPRKQ